MNWLRETHGTKFELMRHFLARMFDGEWSSAGGQWQSVAVGVFALFLPSGMLLVREGSLDPAYSAKYRLLSALDTPDAFRAAALADQLALLTLVLAVTGLLALLQWQALFPTRRDYLALAGFPVRPRQVFVARFATVSLFSLALVVAMNLLPSLIAPLEFAGRWQRNPSYGPNALAEAVACGLGCCFILFALVALQGVLLNLVPGRWFARASVWVQGTLTGALLLAGFRSWSIQEWTPRDLAALPRFGAWLPPVWFAALHEVLLGERDPFFTAMAHRALAATAAAVLLAALAYLVSYRRYRTLLVESPVRLVASHRRQWSLSGLLARTPRQQAVMDFMARTLARSRAHRVIWLAYLGATAAVLLNSSVLNGQAFHHRDGWRPALQFVVLFWPLAATATLLNGFRHVLSVPAELRANWLFQITESQGRAEWMAAVERFILAYTLLPLYAVSLPLAIHVLGWPLAARMSALQILVSLSAFELRFYSWQRLPFTCSYVPGKHPLVAVLGGYIVLLGAIVPGIAIYIAAASRFAPMFYVFLVALIATWIWLRRRRAEGWGEARLEYEDLFEEVPSLGIKEMTYGGTQIRRPAAGDAGHADSQDVDSRSDARLRGGGLDPADLRGRVEGGGGGALPGAAPAGTARTAVGGVGSLGEQSPRPVLPPDAVGPQAPGGGDATLETHRLGHRPHFGTRLANGDFGEFAASLYLRLRAVWKRRQLDRDLADELAFHVDMRAAQYAGEGATAAGAQAAARRRFGNLASIQEHCRDLWTFVWLETFWQDLRYAARQLRRSPGFAASAALTLALGIGATTAVYSMLAAVLWRPVPLPAVASLVFVYQAAPGQAMPYTPADAADLDDVRRETTAIQDLATWQISRHNLVDAGGEPMVAESARVSPNFFDMLRVTPARGRCFRPEEDQPGHERVVVLSDSLWRQHFAADPAIVGRNIRVDEENFTVIGVMPPDFRFPRSWRDMWVPLVRSARDRTTHSGAPLESAGRLRPGYGFAQATAELGAIAARLEQRYPQTNQKRRFLALSFRSYWYGEMAPVMASLMLGAALFVLLIACVNVANLQFARATVRAREVAVRTALGSGRLRLVRQLLTESVLLAAVGAALGLLVARWCLALLKAGVPVEMRHYLAGWDDIGLNRQALAFTLVAALASGIVAGLAPALRSLRVDLAESLKEGGHGASPGRGGGRWRAVLVTGEVALATVLLVGSVLMVRGFGALVAGGSRVQPASMLTMRLALGETQYPENRQVAAFYRQVLERVAAVPGVQSAVAATGLPYSRRYSSGRFSIQGREDTPGQQPVAVMEAVTPDYFHALFIPLRAGRFLTESDGPRTTPVAVIGERAARRWWPGGQPVGDRIRLGDRGWFTIVGVVGDIPYTALSREPDPAVYVPFVQAPDRVMDIGLRIAGDPLQAAPLVREAVRALDPELPITNLNTMDTLIRQESMGIAIMAGVMGVSGLLALLLSAVGVYGVMAYSVSARTHETGIRMALGARRGQVAAMLFRGGIRSALAGLVLGLIPAWGLARVMQSFVFGVKALDAAAFLGVPLLLVAVAAAAISIPALRAARTDPLRALHHE